jgi:transcriptional regulator with XRE-family HTH domain
VPTPRRRAQAEPEPIGSAIRRLRLQRNWSQETLAFEVRRHHQSAPTAGAIGQIERGVVRPTERTIKGIAAALGIAPARFAEYRLAAIRRLFDENKVGLERAAANLAHFEHAFGNPARSTSTAIRPKPARKRAARKR